MALTIDDALARATGQHQLLYNLIARLIRTEEYLPALMLLYAAIDGAAWLAELQGPNATNGKQFKTYVAKYVLRGREKITPDDLWGARCGILHTQTPTSDHSKKNKANEIHYDLRIGKGLGQTLRPRPQASHVVNPVGLLTKWFSGWQRCAKDLKADASRHAAFIAKVEHLMEVVNLPRIPVLIKKRSI